jgi:hypothetical protein
MRPLYRYNQEAETSHLLDTSGRRPGWPLKRLLDRYIHEAETGHLLAQFCDQKKELFLGLYKLCFI